MDKLDKMVFDAIEERKLNKSSFKELYYNVFKKDFAKDECRKRLNGIYDYLEFKSNQESSEFSGVDTGKCVTELKSDGSFMSDKKIVMTVEQAKDTYFLLRAHGFDSNHWEISSARSSVWQAGNADNQLYASKICVKPRFKTFDENWIKDTLNNIDYSDINLNYVTKKATQSGHILEINLPDAHIGKFVNELVSEGIYDTNIAINRFKKGINGILKAVSHTDIEKIFFIVGQDYLNVDHLDFSTTKGTVQDRNEFFESLYKKALQCLTETIIKLHKIAPLEVVYVPGNHDKLTTHTMVVGIENMYKSCFVNKDNSNSITFDSGMKHRKYITFGNVLLGLSHGETEKKRIFNCMQNDVPQYWHKPYRYYHLSHFHSLKTQDIGGVEYEWLQSISQECKWTYEMGFVGAKKVANGFLYTKDAGMYLKIFAPV